MTRSEKIRMFSQTNKYGISMYYRIDNGNHIPILYYQKGNRIFLTDIPDNGKLFRDVYGDFEDFDLSTFDFHFKHSVKIIERK